MSKRVRERLRRFKDVDVPLDEIARRSRLQSAPRELPDVAPSRQRLVTVVAAFAIFALAASLFFVPVLRSSSPNTQVGTPTGSDSSTIAPLDPAAICDVPAYDPTIALLVGNETTAYPKAVLEGSGSPASDMQGPATDELRSYIASSAGQHAPDVGWRVIDSSAQDVIFAAPRGTATATGGLWASISATASGNARRRRSSTRSRHRPNAATSSPSRGPTA